MDDRGVGSDCANVKAFSPKRPVELWGPPSFLYMVTDGISSWGNRPVDEATTNLYLLWNLKMCGAIRTLPHTPS